MRDFWLSDPADPIIGWTARDEVLIKKREHVQRTALRGTQNYLSVSFNRTIIATGIDIVNGPLHTSIRVLGGLKDYCRLH